jgi:tetratricopeptide (TPR) repeat protein
MTLFGLTLFGRSFGDGKSVANLIPDELRVSFDARIDTDSTLSINDVDKLLKQYPNDDYLLGMRMYLLVLFEKNKDCKKEVERLKKFSRLGTYTYTFIAYYLLIVEEDHERAIQYCELAREADVRKVNFYAIDIKADILFGRKQYEESLILCEEAVVMSKNKLRIIDGFITNLMVLKQYDKAKYYADYMYLKTTDKTLLSGAEYCYGEIAENSGNLVEAVEHYIKTALYSYDHDYGYYDACDLLIRINDWERVKTFIDSIPETKKNKTDLIYLRSVINEHEGNYRLALEQINTVLKSEQRENFYIKKLDYQLHLRQVKEAESTYRIIRELYGNYLYLKAYEIVMLLLGNRNEGLRRYNEVMGGDDEEMKEMMSLLLKLQHIDIEKLKA